MRLIDADALKRLFRNVNESMFQLSRVYELIDNAPTVVEHIVVDKINGDTGKITYHSADMRGEEE